MVIDRNKLLSLIDEAGIVGAGGGGFPAAVKLAGNFSHYIANGAECEPMLHKDIELMERHPKEIAEMLAIMRDATDAQNTYFAAKEKYKKKKQKISPFLKKHKITPIYLDDIFPAGDEFEIVERVLGKVIPPANIPLAVDAAVNNVETLLNIRRAIDGKPVIEKWLTVAGEVEKPFTAVVPLGTPASHLLKFAIPKLENYILIEGGPMMGVIVDSEEPVKKTTSGFIVLSPEHPIVRYRTMPINYVLRIAASACSQCRSCTDLCPRYLLGHPLEPHKIMRSAAMPLSLPVETMTAALLCSECGICEQFACPMGLSPRRINQELKKRFAQQDVRYNWNGKNISPRDVREFRRIPARRLAERLGILKYLDIHPKFIPAFPPSEKLLLPLKQNAGAPSQAIVKVGEKVSAGQKIAVVPQGKLGAPLHSPIDGKVIQTMQNIVISR